MIIKMSQFVTYNKFSNCYSISLNKEDIADPDKSFLLLVDTDNQRAKLKEMFDISNNSNIPYIEVNLSVCFTMDGYIVIYDNSVINKGRKRKLFHVCNNTVKTWQHSHMFYCKQWYPLDLKYWDLQGNNFIICSAVQFKYQLKTIIPKVCEEYPQLFDTSTTFNELYNILYTLDPINLDTQK